MELRERKENRLGGYDYSLAGCYFVTVCVKDRYEILGDVVSARPPSVGGGVPDAPFVKLSDVGTIVNNRIIEMNKQYAHVSVDKYIVMPNHIHMILSVNEKTNGGSSRTPTPTNAVIPSFISTLKRFTNKDAGFAFWQRSYHDRIIRNEQEYVKIRNYIDTNPSKWTEDKYYTLRDAE